VNGAWQAADVNRTFRVNRAWQAVDVNGSHIRRPLSQEGEDLFLGVKKVTYTFEKSS